MDDTNNTSDTLGAATYSGLMDSQHFDRSLRTWGIDGSDPTATAIQGPCDATHTSCRIYDWDLSAAASIVRNVLASPTAGTGITHTWSTGSATTFLLSAVERIGDGIGNDNGLCESAEVCIATPNLGAYQGHGPLVPAGGTGTGSQVPNVTLYAYSQNGY